MEVDDNVLVRDCLKGNSSAFETLVDKYERPIFNISFRMVKDSDDAEDITQTVFIKAYENLRDFNPKYKFFSWIYRMAINESINFINQKSRKTEIDRNLIVKEKSLDDVINGLELSEKIQEALIVLDINYRVVLVLKHFMNCSYREISDILETPEKTIKSRLYTARQILKDILLNKKVIEND